MGYIGSAKDDKNPVIGDYQRNPKQGETERFSIRIPSKKVSSIHTDDLKGKSANTGSTHP